ncbi:site-specific integrase [Micromonospora sp. HK10]|uniref:tyrosine-type recombinase/integrase n=1 Tax=Micromonospora sp. HK10 TaxID=1538294 RepID=UPI000AE9F11F|nr:site-specific integrase [Micromonospora sp. HK10]
MVSLEARRAAFGQFVRRALQDAKDRRITIKEIERRTGVGSTTLYRWRDGDWTADPRPSQVDAFCAGLDIPTAAAYRGARLGRRRERALEVALRRGLVGRNVAKLIDAPSGRSPKMTFLTEQEAMKVLAAAAGQRNAARWSVALALGLRQGKALGLRWSHVDLDAGHMEIPKQLRRRIYEHGCGGTCGASGGADCPQRSGAASSWWSQRARASGRCRSRHRWWRSCAPTTGSSWPNAPPPASGGTRGTSCSPKTTAARWTRGRTTRLCGTCSTRPR